MSAQNEIILPRVDENIMNSHCGKIFHMEFHPALPPLERNKKARLCPGIQDLRIFRVFPKDPDIGLRGKVSRDIDPSLPDIFGFKHPGTEVIQHVTIKSTVSLLC